MMRSPSLLSLSGPPWPIVVAHDRVLYTGQIELFDIKTLKTIDLWWTELFEIELFDYLTVFIQMTDILLNYYLYLAILGNI